MVLRQSQVSVGLGRNGCLNCPAQSLSVNSVCRGGSPSRSYSCHIDFLEWQASVHPSEMASVTFHVAVQPGVASVHASILQKAPNGVSFYIRDFPQLAGMKYGDARRCFNTSVLCGCFSADDTLPHLNPKDDHVFQQNDKLIFLSNTGLLS